MELSSLTDVHLCQECKRAPLFAQINLVLENTPSCLSLLRGPLFSSYDPSISGVIDMQYFPGRWTEGMVTVEFPLFLSPVGRRPQIYERKANYFLEQACFLFTGHLNFPCAAPFPVSLKPPISIKPTATGSGGYPPEGRKSWGFISPPEPPLVPPL